MAGKKSPSEQEEFHTHPCHPIPGESYQIHITNRFERDRHLGLAFWSTVRNGTVEWPAGSQAKATLFPETAGGCVFVIKELQPRLWIVRCVAADHGN